MGARPARVSLVTGSGGVTVLRSPPTSTPSLGKHLFCDVITGLGEFFVYLSFPGGSDGKEST